MNYRYTVQQFGWLIMGLAVGELVMALYGLIRWLQGVEREGSAVIALGACGVVTMLAALLMRYFTRGAKEKFSTREALLLVSMAWLIGAAIAGAPYMVWSWIGVEGRHIFNNPVDAYFEAMSGLTTTGATVLSDIEVLPESLLLWRSLTHWFGGLGIVVLFVAVLPSLGVGGKKLFKVEAPGPSQEGVRPHIRETARVLWLIYSVFTLVEILLLWIAGMSLFDAVCHTMATLATGGFSTKNASVGHYHHISVWVDMIVIVFMFLAGVNFALYFHVIRGKWRNLFKDVEFRVYLTVIVIATLIITLALLTQGTEMVMTHPEDHTMKGSPNAQIAVHWGDPWSYPQAMRQSTFQVVSIITTTGFGTADFTVWPFIAQAILVGLMFMGGCAGSTGGGIKVIRVWLVLKILWSQVELSFRPNVVRPLKLGKTPIGQDLRLSVISYVMALLGFFVLGAIGIQLLESMLGDGKCTFLTAGTASVATLFNVGPGLGLVSPVNNYGWFSWPSKALMCLLMAIGRLEMFAIIVLFTPRFWRGG